MGESGGEKCFVTSDGRTIAFVANWFALKRWPFEANTYPEFVERVLAPQSAHRTASATADVYPRAAHFFIPKLITAEAIIQLLGEACVELPPGAVMLDMGTGPAIIPRIFKLLGICEKVYGIDLLDRRGDLPDDQFLELIAAERTTLLAAQGESPILKRFKMGDGVNFWTVPVSLPLVADPRRDASMDGYFVSDFLAFDGAGLRFDLITTFAGMCYFNMRDYFAKVAGLLKPGGIHYLMDTNFYHLYGESLELPLDAPWLHARVTKDDLFRYYREHRPDLEPYVRHGFFTPESHYCIADVITCAKGFGLTPLLFRRSYRPNEIDMVHYSSGRNLEFIVTTVLADCRTINPKVGFLDLLAHAWTVIFRKA